MVLHHAKITALRNKYYLEKVVPLYLKPLEPKREYLVVCINGHTSYSKDVLVINDKNIFIDIYTP